MTSTVYTPCVTAAVVAAPKHAVDTRWTSPLTGPTDALLTKTGHVGHTASGQDIS